MHSNLSRMYGVGIMAFVLFLSTLVGVPVLPALSRELGADTTEISIVVSAALAFFPALLWLPKDAGSSMSVQALSARRW